MKYVCPMQKVALVCHELSVTVELGSRAIRPMQRMSPCPHLSVLPRR